MRNRCERGMRIALVGIGIASILVWTSAGEAILFDKLGEKDLPVPRFTVKTTGTVQDGSFQLSWSLPQKFPLFLPVYFELQESTEQDFTNPVTINVGADRGTFVSGLPNGSYFYRVRMVDSDNKVLSPWSAPVQRNVGHHSLIFALSLMSIGSVVFFSTVVMILRGIKHHS